MREPFRIVLVKTTGPANLGAAARAMANMGLSDLVLVSPKCGPDDEQAVAFATHGRQVLDAARIVDDIPEALRDCVKTFACSGKLGLYRRQAAITPHAAANLAVEYVADGPVAFVFGPENHGLRVGELLKFDRIVSIPADPAYPVLNLATAVAIVAYELHRARLAADGQPPLPTVRNAELATDEKKSRIYEYLFDGLDRIGFFCEQSPDKLKYALRHLFGRVDLSENEADILIGMARQIQWYARNHPDRVDPPS